MHRKEFMLATMLLHVHSLLLHQANILSTPSHINMLG